MSVKIAINGFGRIGRNILRSALQQGMGELDLVAINDLTDAATLGHLFKYDSVHGVYEGDVQVDGNALVIDGERFVVKYGSGSRLYRYAKGNVEEVWQSRAFGNTFALPVLREVAASRACRRQHAFWA